MKHLWVLAALLTSSIVNAGTIHFEHRRVTNEEVDPFPTGFWQGTIGFGGASFVQDLQPDSAPVSVQLADLTSFDYFFNYTTVRPGEFGKGGYVTFRLADLTSFAATAAYSPIGAVSGVSQGLGITFETRFADWGVSSPAFPRVRLVARDGIVRLISEAEGEVYDAPLKSGVPEPSVWMLLLTAFMVAGVALRRGRDVMRAEAS